MVRVRARARVKAWRCKVRVRAGARPVVRRQHTARGVGDNTEPVVGEGLEEGAVRLLGSAADEGTADKMYDPTALASELGQQHVARADLLPPPCRPHGRRGIGALAVRLAGPRGGGLAAWRMMVASRYGRGEREQRAAAQSDHAARDEARREHAGAKGRRETALKKLFFSFRNSVFCLK
jgi:hypothetical protein